MKRKTKRMDSGGSVFDPERIRADRALIPPSLRGEEEGLEGVYPEEFLPIGRAARGISGLADAALMKLPNRVRNVVTDVAPGKQSILSGRLPSSAEDVTHAYRNMSQAELDNAIATGRLRKTPASVKTDWDKSQKFWSPGDEAGSFGRTWKGASDATVRAPIDKVRGKNWAVKREDLQRLNKETGEYESFKKGGKVTANSASKRGDGIAKRGKTKGTMR